MNLGALKQQMAMARSLDQVVRMLEQPGAAEAIATRPEVEGEVEDLDWIPKFTRECHQSSGDGWEIVSWDAFRSVMVHCGIPEFNGQEYQRDYWVSVAARHFRETDVQHIEAALRQLGATDEEVAALADMLHAVAWGHCHHDLSLNPRQVIAERLGWYRETHAVPA
jgi:hypothetical protein